MRPKVIPNSNAALASAASKVGFRLNGTRSKDFRHCDMTLGKSPGSCEVVFEHGTRVFCQVSSTIGEPSDSRPGEGILTVSTWISPTAHGETGGSTTGSKIAKPAIIARIIEKLFKDNRVVDMESLCIKFGEKAWVVRIDIHILDTNGCLAEAAALAAVGGLLTFRRPQANVDVNTGDLIVSSTEEAVPVRLHLNHLPVLTSFALTPSRTILAEPDQQEEDIFPGKLFVAINESKEVCYLHVTTQITYDVLSEATALAQAKCLERVKWIKELVRKDDELRAVPVYMRNLESIRNGKVIDLCDLDTTPYSAGFDSTSRKQPIPFPSTDEIRIVQTIT